MRAGRWVTLTRTLAPCDGSAMLPSGGRYFVCRLAGENLEAALANGGPE